MQGVKTFYFISRAQTALPHAEILSLMGQILGFVSLLALPLLLASCIKVT